MTLGTRWYACGVLQAGAHSPRSNVVTYMILAVLEDELISFGTFTPTESVGTTEEEITLESTVFTEPSTSHGCFFMDDRPVMSYCTSRLEVCLNLKTKT